MKVVKYPSSKIDLYLIKNFLNKEECKHLINICRGKLESSTVVSGNRGIVDKQSRTSKTCHLYDGHDIVVDNINKRICKMISNISGTQITNDYSESLQLQYYKVGQEFRAHHDYFASEYANNNAQGNRTWTCMVYLNNVAEGGETRFVDLDMNVNPVYGRAVIWNNYKNGNTNPHTLHAGMPVKKGVKFIITKWFRERPH